MFLAVQNANQKSRQTTPVSTLKPTPVDTAKELKPKEPPKTIDKHQQKTEEETKHSREINDTDPSPLKQHHRHCVPEEPPKVFKKKAPVPIQEDKPTPGVRASRQVGPTETGKPTEPHKISEQPKSTAPLTIPETIVTKSGSNVTTRPDIKISGHDPIRPPGQEGLPKPPTKDRPKSPGPDGPRPRGIVETRPLKGETKPPPQVIPKFELSPASNSSVPSVSFSSSTEQLIVAGSPEPLKVGKRVEDVNTIKRPSKAGWL